MDQEAHAGDNGEHRQRETIQHQVETDVEITDRHPGPQRYAEGLTPVIKEVDTRIRCHQRSQTHRAHADGGGQILRPAATRKRQQHEANQRKNNG